MALDFLLYVLVIALSGFGNLECFTMSGYYIHHALEILTKNSFRNKFNCFTNPSMTIRKKIIYRLIKDRDKHLAFSIMKPFYCKAHDMVN